MKMDDPEDNLLKREISKYFSLDQEKNRILLVGHTGNYTGGAEILLEHMAREFVKQDVDVVIFVKNDGPIIKSYKKIAPTFVVDDDLKMENSIKELSKYGFEIAILNTVISGNFLPKLKKHGFYTIHLVHELPKTIKFLKAEHLAKMIGKYADLVIFPSNYVLEKFETITEVKNKVIQPQGLYKTHDKFNKKVSREKLEKIYDIPKNNHIILSVGRGELRKGCDLFIELFNRLKNDNYTFIWAGVVANEMKSDEFFEITKEKNLIFTGFISDTEELMTLYDACDVFVLTSREDPFPSAVLEAFNAKKPVIAFKDAGGFQDIVIDDVSGYLVNYESVDELFDKLKFVCNNQQLIETLGNNAYNICQKYDFPKYVQVLKTYCIDGEILLLKEKVSNLQKENIKLNGTIDEILSSSSWKITSPLRKLKYYIAHLFN